MRFGWRPKHGSASFRRVIIKSGLNASPSTYRFYYKLLLYETFIRWLLFITIDKFIIYDGQQSGKDFFMDTTKSNLMD